MKSLLVHVLLLLALLQLASSFPLPPRESVAEAPAATRVGDDWRRTANGWERMSDWETPSAAGGSWCHLDAIHPSVLASLQLLISTAALLAFPVKTDSRNR